MLIYLSYIPASQGTKMHIAQYSNKPRSRNTIWLVTRLTTKNYNFRELCTPRSSLNTLLRHWQHWSIEALTVYQILSNSTLHVRMHGPGILVTTQLTLLSTIWRLLLLEQPIFEIFGTNQSHSDLSLICQLHFLLRGKFHVPLYSGLLETLILFVIWTSFLIWINLSNERYRH